MIYSTIKDLFKGICDAIRSKDGTAEAINHQDIPSRIQAIQSGLDTSDATASATDILSGKTAYVNGQKVTGSIASQAAQTITPGTADKTIEKGKYLSGAQTIKGDSNLVAGNIVKGVSIFGVDGAADTSGIDTSDATATADDMAKGVTAYVNGEKVTGTLPDSKTCDIPFSSINTSDPDNARIVAKPTERRIISPSPGLIVVPVPYSKFGDATAADVAAGKTFTSAAGLKATGTMQSKAAATYTPGTSDQTIASGQYLSGAQTIKGDSNLVAGNIKSGVSIFGVSGTYSGSGGSGSGIQAQHITSASETITISGSGTVKVWGYGHYSSGTYSNTMYAFVGDGYYKSASYGSPSKTNASFSISNGTLSGLPSNITTLDVLVTIGI